MLLKRVPDAPLPALFAVPLLCKAIPRDCRSTLVTGSSTLGTHHSMGVKCALDAAHTTTLRAIGHALTNRSVSRAFFDWP
jgi:hypothetical protein